MAKLTLADVSNLLGNPTSAANTINANNALVEAALENTLSRDGTIPNQMTTDLDMNNNDILNGADANFDRLYLDGELVIPGDVTSAQVATQDEAEVGTNNDKIMTPLRTKQAVSFYGRDLLNVAPYVSRTEMKGLDTSKDLVSILYESGREGLFRWTVGDFSALITADPQEGVYIKADTVPSTSGAWVRELGSRKSLDVRWFGAVADSTGVGFGTDSFVSLQAAINLAVVIGSDVDFGEGRYRSTATLVYNRTTLNSNFGRVPGIIGAGAAMSGIFFDAGVLLGLDIQGSTSAGVFGGFFTIEGFTLWTSGKIGQGLKIKDGAFILVSQVRCRGWDNGFLLQNVISSRFSQIFADGNIAGVLAENGPSAIPCNALTFENCWISGNDRIGYDLTNVATFNIISGSCEGNGIVTFGAAPNTSGGIRAVNCGQGGHVGLVVQGVYFEHNAGVADLLLFNDAALSSVSKMCSHVIQGNIFNRVHATEFTTNNININTTAVPQKVVLSGNGHGNLGTSGYVENSARKYVLAVDPGNVLTIEDDGSNMYTSSTAAPDFSNTYVRGSFVEAEAIGYVDGATGNLLAGSKNVSSVTRLAAGRYQITLRRSWAGRKACFVIADNRRTPYTFTIDNNSVTVELQDGTTPTDASFNFAVFKPFY